MRQVIERSPTCRGTLGFVWDIKRSRVSRGIVTCIKRSSQQHFSSKTSTHYPLYDFDLRATQARTLLPAALASVSFGFVLVRVRTKTQRAQSQKPMAAFYGISFRLNLFDEIHVISLRLPGWTKFGSYRQRNFAIFRLSTLSDLLSQQLATTIATTTAAILATSNEAQARPCKACRKD